MNRSLRAKTGIILLIFISLLSNINLFKKSFILYREKGGSNKITAYLDRFDNIRKDLPLNGIVGYISDMRPYDSEDGTWDYYLTQYELCPLVIDMNNDHKWVVGNFSSNTSFIPNSSLSNLVPVRNYGNGLILFRNKVK